VRLADFRRAGLRRQAENLVSLPDAHRPPGARGAGTGALGGGVG
jgi:hypothetical protein